MSIEVDIDETACALYGNCTSVAPAVFDIDPDEDVAMLLPGRPLDSDLADVEQAVAGCPMRAIRIRPTSG